jgi:poly(3-hydroxybutyrate) depolymerase
VLGVWLLSTSVWAQPASLLALGDRLDIELDRISVSGISSGGYMAQQFHVAHSAHVSGAGIIAGGPYRCAAGSYPPFSWFDFSGLYTATSVCSDTNPYWFFQGPPDVDFSIDETRREAAAGTIDDPAHLRGDRIWLLSGSEDRTVPSKVVDALRRYYLEFVGESDLRYVKLDGAGHAMITDDYGNECAQSRSPYISDCDFDAAGALLAHVYGALRPRAADSELQAALEFDQTGYFDPADAGISLNRVGHVYVPDRCLAGERCRLHVAFHGCQQHQELIGDDFYTQSGYNGWAQTNGLVILYPQTRASRPALLPGSGSNPKGCWDWWGYSGDDYHRKSGAQIRAVADMVNHLVGARLLDTTAPTD